MIPENYLTPVLFQGVNFWKQPVKGLKTIFHDIVLKGLQKDRNEIQAKSL